MKKGKDYIGVGVGAAIINKDRKVFITQRGPKAKNERGKWEIPGGGVDFGETFKQAAIREVQEECDCTIEIVDLLGICDHIIADEGEHWVSPTFICKLVKGQPRIVEPEKCSAAGWFTLAEAEKLDLSIVTKFDIGILKEKYPNGLPDLYS